MKRLILCLFLTGCQVDHDVEIKPIKVTIEPIELFVCVDGFYWWFNKDPITLDGKQLTCTEEN